MRCLALAEAWQDAGGRALFVIAKGSRAIENRLKSEGMGVVRLAAQRGSHDGALKTAKVARKVDASWIVLDGYRFSHTYQRRVRASGAKLLFIDDNGITGRYHSDIILDQNVGAHERSYAEREPFTKLLLGSRYALLRREFLKWRGWKRKTPEIARRVLVTLGGGDAGNATAKVIEALDSVRIEDLEVRVVVGHTNPHLRMLENLVRNARHFFRIEPTVSDMAELMAWADAAVSGGGSTCWELMYMCLPSAVLTLAANQDPTVRELAKRNEVLSLGQSRSCNPHRMAARLQSLLSNRRMRQRLARRGRRVVDGLGAWRIVQVLLGTLGKVGTS
jgi:UDP-2,4-diacetamido-2,4,6-trideoxy-beta-L-altropyranose hydrolase